MRKKIVLAVALFAVLICVLYFAAGCSTENAVHPVNNLRGYAFLQKVTDNTPDGVVNYVALKISNSTSGSVPERQYNVTLPSGEGIILENNTSVSTFQNYYFGQTETPVGQINNPFSPPASVTPYEFFMFVFPGEEMGRYVFNFQHDPVVINDNVPYSEPVAIEAPAPGEQFTQGEPFVVTWTPLGASYRYLVGASIEDPLSADTPVQWTNADISGLDYRDPETIQALLDDLQADNTVTVPNNIFPPGSTVTIQIMAFNRDAFRFTNTVPYGSIVMHISSTESYATIAP